MNVIRLLLLALVAPLLVACSEPSKFRAYNGPEVTRITVHKEVRLMRLWHEDRVLRQYRVGLGWAPVGQKRREGDGRTPEGAYIIDRRNPQSRFHLSLGVSYPRPSDRVRAREAGDAPGGDIFIHGKGPEFADASGDWTDGCIAVTDRQIEQIYAMVRKGTPIVITP